MRVLVFGGAGFLGSHLVDRLINLEHEVAVVDDMSTGNENNLKHINNKNLLGIYQDDIRYFPFFDKKPFDYNFDVVYNLACPASPVHYQTDPIKTFTTCTVGTLRALQYANMLGAVFVQASTSEVYGDPNCSPQPETYWGNVNPIGERSMYDEGKRGSECILFNFSRMYGTRIKVIRIFNTYGPRMQVNDGRVISNFIVQALKGEDITVYGNGQQTRSFCYVDDLINGFISVLNTSDDFKGPVNIGNDGEFTILRLANAVIKMTDSSSKIVYRPLPNDDPMQRKPDLTLAKKMLGYEPKIDLGEGLDRTIKYFRSVL
jgi:UDP-glucuronate decarboxylase